MPRWLKQVLYPHSWWIGLVILAALVAAYAGMPHARESIIALAGGMVGAFYFLQKHYLDELALFARLFTEFNQRYAELNARLQLLVGQRMPLSSSDQALLEDYFNLCAEEYFYFSCGIIDSRVWHAWCKGMQQFFDDPRVTEFWDREQTNGSYYGLTRHAIEAGARTRHAEVRTVADDPELPTRKAA